MLTIKVLDATFNQEQSTDRNYIYTFDSKELGLPYIQLEILNQEKYLCFVLERLDLFQDDNDILEAIEFTIDENVSILVRDFDPKRIIEVRSIFHNNKSCYLYKYLFSSKRSKKERILQELR